MPYLWLQGNETEAVGIFSQSRKSHCLIFNGDANSTQKGPAFFEQWCRKFIYFWLCFCFPLSLPILFYFLNKKFSHFWLGVFQYLHDSLTSCKFILWKGRDKMFFNDHMNLLWLCCHLVFAFCHYTLYSLLQCCFHIFYKFYYS